MIASQAHTNDPLDVLHHFLLWHDAGAPLDAAREAFTQLRDALAAARAENEVLRKANVQLRVDLANERNRRAAVEDERDALAAQEGTDG